MVYSGSSNQESVIRINRKLDSVAVLIPAYRPDARLIELVDALRAADFHRIVVVDDGGGADFRGIFRALEGKAEVLVHDVNRGKGAALKTGIAHIARTKGVSVVTADADGQHAPRDIAAIAHALLAMPEALILGSRDKKQMPPRSKAGNTLTCALFAAATFRWVGDTQTGLRGLPAGALADMATLEGDRYEYEMNMLLHACRAGMKIREVTIETIYIGNNETSHFHPIRDGLRIYGLIFRKLGRFLTASVMAAAVDYALFWLLQMLPVGRAVMLGRVPVDAALLISVVGARVVSSLFNYCVNRNLVFKSAAKGTLWRYAALVVAILAGDYVLIDLLERIGLPTLLSKGIADIFLFICSYRVQDRRIFKK